MRKFSTVLKAAIKDAGNIRNAELAKHIRSVKQIHSSGKTSEVTISRWKSGTPANGKVQVPSTREQILDMIKPLRLTQNANGLNMCNELLNAARFPELDANERKKYFPNAGKEIPTDTPKNELLKVATIFPEPNVDEIDKEVTTDIPKNEILPAKSFCLLRTELLNKIDEKCTSQLKPIKGNWLNTNVEIKKISDNSTNHFPFLSLKSPQFFQVFEHDFIVLLGEAGTGKSLTVHYIAKKLTTQAKDDLEKPIPLIFHLADWATKSLSFEDWLKQQLTFLGLAEKNINADFETLVDCQRCIFFLDGFDNLFPEQYVTRLQEINYFIQKHGEVYLGGMVIISRPDEYIFAEQLLLEKFDQDKVFHFYTTADIQVLEFDYVCSYITEHASGLQLDKIIEGRNKFEQILNIPFGLVLFIENHQNNLELNDTDIKTSLISSYVDKHFTDNDVKAPYTEEEVKTWLGHIAKFTGIGETFRVETLAPKTVLNEKQQRQYQWWFAGIFGIIFGLLMGSIGGILFGERLPEKNIGNSETILPNIMTNVGEVLRHWVNDGSILEKFSLIISYAGIATLCSLFMSILSFVLFKRLSEQIIKHTTLPSNIVYKIIKRSNFALFLGGYFGLFLGITGWLVDGWEWGLHVFILYGILGALIGLMTDSNHTDALAIELKKDIWFSHTILFEQLRQNIFSWLLIPLTMLIMFGFTYVFAKLSVAVALLQGFIIGFSFTISYNFYRLRTEIDWKKRAFLPNQKINVALKRVISIFAIISLTITLLVTSLSIFILQWPGNLSIGLRVGMQVGVMLSFIFYGGTDVLKYLILRWFMYKQDMTPWNYIKFLEYCKQLTFLRSQSGGYAFRHDWFQEYFRK